MKRIKWIHIALCLLIVAAAIVVRVCVIHMVTVSDDSCAPRLHAGDRVAVLRALCSSMPERGDIVTFTHPATGSELYVGTIAAAPSDTLWIDADGQLTTRHEAADLVVVPAEGQQLLIDVQNIRLFNQAIQLYEPVKSAIIDEALYVSGEAVEHYRFTQSYYWLQGNRPDLDSRTLGLIPASHITGTVQCVLYGHDPSQPLWKGWRWR